MSGETEAAPSAWTIDSLQSHIVTLLEERTRHFDERYDSISELIQEISHRHDMLFAERLRAFEEADKRFEQRFIAQQEAIQAALLAQKEAVSAALIAADRAVGKAELASEKRFEGVNEFRGQLADQAAQLMPRQEAESRISSLSDKLADMTLLSRDMTDRIRQEHQTAITAVRDEMQKGLAVLSQTQAISQGRGSGFTSSWGYLIGAVTLIAVLMTIADRLVK